MMVARTPPAVSPTRFGRFHGKAFGPGVVGNVIAANVVPAVAAQPGVVVEFNAVELVVVHDLERFSVNVSASPFLSVTEGRRIAGGDSVVEAVGVLLHDDTIRANDERALRE